MFGPEIHGSCVDVEHAYLFEDWYEHYEDSEDFTKDYEESGSGYDVEEFGSGVLEEAYRETVYAMNEFAESGLLDDGYEDQYDEELEVYDEYM